MCPNNVAICMAGDFDPDKTIAIIDRYFGLWKPGADVSQPVFPVQRPLTAPADTTVIGQQAEQVLVAWLAKKASDLQCDTLEVIGEMLSNGKAGLFDLNLNQAMRVQEASGHELPAGLLRLHPDGYAQARASRWKRSAR